MKTQAVLSLVVAILLSIFMRTATAAQMEAGDTVSSGKEIKQPEIEKLPEEGFKEITAPEVKVMLDEGKALVVNVMSGVEYSLQHISGSINIPLNYMKSTDKLPQDKNTPLVFYCMAKV